MTILGISAGFHDAAVSVIDDHGNIAFAAHSERYSKKKNDAHLHADLLAECCAWDFDTVAFYERPWMHNIQQWASGQRSYGPWTVRQALRQHLGGWYQRPARRELGFAHHQSHAAAGFQTSPFDRATVVVIDAIGELDTISIWKAAYDRRGRAVYEKVWAQGYPHSIGLFYSAVTGRVGLRPLDEEYILMGMAAYGRDAMADRLRQDFVRDPWSVRFRENLHTGMSGYAPDADDFDLARGAQTVAEELIRNVMMRARALDWSSNLVYMGGVALNCSANRLLGHYFDRVWIMPCPGDAGSSLGAAALAYGKRVNWQDAYLGHCIAGDYPVEALLAELETNQIVGVASGRAEFGPRALGNRSLLADPRGPNIKDRVNDIKRRQKFRPFAPVILEELVHDYFSMPRGWDHSRYMQVVADCRLPDLFPAIIHADGSSRVQCVPADGSGIRRLLEAWFERTGCPMLLNTSLNIRGEPMVNDRTDADRFEKEYGVKVCS